MATYKDTMRWVAELDNSDVLEGFKQIKDDGTEALDDVGDKSEGLTDKFKSSGGKWGKALIGGFAAIGVGAILLQGINDAFARQDALNVVTGQFRLTAEEAEKYGGIAGDLYAEGWGNSLDEVQGAVAQAARKLSTTTDDELKIVTERVIAVGKTWGEDFDAIIRSTDQLVQNDLAPNAIAALDLIVGAFQEGGNEAGDLLDTIDEYSQHWSAMGLSGEDALNQIIHGFQNGQRDADKMADAVKEMRIRVVDDTDKIDDAYRDLGLDADATRLKFLEGGGAAREAFIEVINALRSVEDPIEQNRLAVELIGTQYEDLGPTALDSLASIDGALDDTTGRAQELADTVEATPWDRLQRRGESAFTALGNRLANSIITPLEDAEALLDVLTGGGDDSPIAIAAEPISQETIDAMGEYQDGIIGATEATEDLEEATDDNIGTTGESKRTTLDLKGAYDRATESLKRSVEETYRKIDAEKAARGESRRLADKTYDLRDAEDDLFDSIENANEILRDQKADGRDAAKSLRDVARDADAAAVKQVELEGKTLETDAGMRTWNESMLAVVGRLKGPMRREVLNHIARVNGIPTNRVTDIEAALDSGNVKSVDDILTHLARDRTANVRATFTGTGSGALSGGMYAMADGGIAQGGPTLVGEEGPELVDMPRGARVHTAAETRRMTRGGRGGAATYQITVNAGMGANGPDIGRQIVDQIKRFEQGNGPGWRS